MIKKLVYWMKNNIFVVIFYFIFVVITIILLLLNGPRWSFFVIALWIWIFIAIFYIVFKLSKSLFYRIFTKSDDYFNKRRIAKGKSNKQGFFKEFSKIMIKINSLFYSGLLAFIVVYLLLTSIVPFTGYMSAMTQWKADQNQDELESIVNELLKDITDNATKTKSLLAWYDEYSHNIYNDYRLWAKKCLLFRLDGEQIEIYSCEPYIGVRTYADDFSLWILTSRFGHCGEYALLFRDMADLAGLQVRKCTCSGENHCWNEVYINDSIGWKTVDATQVFLPEYNGYDNVNSVNIRNKLSGNLSRVIAEYPDGRTVDVTQNYTSVVNITVIVRDNLGNPIPEAIVQIYSNNRDIGRYTEISEITNQTGEYTFIIGSGNYTFKAWNKNKTKNGTLTKIFSEEVLSDYASIEIS